MTKTELRNEFRKLIEKAQGAGLDQPDIEEAFSEIYEELYPCDEDEDDDDFEDDYDDYEDEDI